MTTATFKLEKVDAEVGRVFVGERIVAHVVWTDSFWCLTGVNQDGILESFTDLTDLSDMGDAYVRAIASGKLESDAQLDFFLDPPTFVGASEGNRRCWIYTAHKLVSSGKNADFREWDNSEFAAANAIFRRVVRKYGDSPPDKTDELKELMAR